MKTTKGEMLIKKTDKVLISHLRRDGRKNVTDIAREENIPATTIYDRVKIVDNKYVKKHSLIMDFNKVGYPIISYITIDLKDKKSNLKAHLMENPNINSLFSMNYGTKLLAEAVFRNIDELDKFIENIQGNFNIERLHADYVTEELKRETFLTDLSHFD